MTNSRREQLVAQVRAMREAHKQAFKRKPRRGKVPAPVPPQAIRAEYLRGIRELVLEPMRALVAKQLEPEFERILPRAAVERGDGIYVYGVSVWISRQEFGEPLSKTPGCWGLTPYADAAGENARALIERLAKQFQEDVGPAQIARLADLIGRRTSEHQREQLRRQLKQALGVDPLMREPASVVERVKAFTAENVALIKTIPQKFFGAIESRVVAGVRQGLRASELAAEIQDRYEVSETDAARIANDQVGKFFGELNRVRQTALGIDRFIWHTVEDNRVRPEHETLDGNTYEWANPPDGGPGQAVNCRCWPEADLEAIMEGLE